MELNFTLNDINTAAEKFLKSIDDHKVIALRGEMGAGKTTFIHAVCVLLGVRTNISSPTFSIINEYSLPGKQGIYHIDLYRLKNEQEAIEAGVEDCLSSGSICFIEWPGIAPGLFGSETLHCELHRISDNERKLEINL